MTDHDLHEPLRRLAETAPAPAPGLAGDVVQRGRTTRRRRLGAVAVAGAAAVAALVVVVPLLGTGDADRGSEPPVATGSTTETEPPAPSDPSAQARVAAAAIRAQARGNYPSARVLQVRASICVRGGLGDRSSSCTAWTEQERAELARLVPAYTLRWVAKPRSGPPLNIGPDQPYVEVSRLGRVDSSGGSMLVFAVFGPRGCVGAEYDVTLDPDRADVAGGETETVVVC